MTQPVYLTLLPATTAALAPAARIWTVRVEEPTGIERRAGELVRVPIGKLGGHRSGFRVRHPRGGREVPAQRDIALAECLYVVHSKFDEIHLRSLLEPAAAGPCPALDLHSGFQAPMPAV